MKIVSWNVNGIRAVHKKGLFLPFVEDVQADVICLQETKAEQGQSEIDLPQYTEYWNSSKGRKGYSGTAIFSKQEPLNIRYDFPAEILKKYKVDKDEYGNLNEEGRIVVAEFETCFVATVYTPNSKPDLSRLSLRYTIWDPAFLAYMQLLEKKKPVIFCGDLNVAHAEIDLANPKANEGEHGFTKEEREGFENYLGAGFVDTFRHLYPEEKNKYTWWTHWANARARNVGWRIDYVLVSKALTKNIKAASIRDDIMGSDHCPVTLEIAL